MKNKKITNFLFLINLLIIFFVSTIYIEIVYKLYHYDSYIHFIMYFITGFLAIIGDKKIVYIKLLIVMILPIITEFIQNFIEMRRSDLVDMYFDYLGLVGGMMVLLLYKYVKKT